MLSETQRGSVATLMSNSNTEKLVFQQYASVGWQASSGSLLVRSVRYTCVKHSNRIHLDVHSWNWVQSNQIQIYSHIDDICCSFFIMATILCQWWSIHLTIKFMAANSAVRDYPVVLNISAWSDKNPSRTPYNRLARWLFPMGSRFHI